MTNREPSDTFGKRYWIRPRNDGRGRDRGELRDRAHFDYQPKRGLIARLLKGNRT
ncbi:hypothetical protein [Streptomyces sp. NPDC019937]|uniref:hypothetical protein n=1 Tax=Streptomyces sp. NPDC019937 TaxID=3154787 RepID=UPI0033F9E176